MAHLPTTEKRLAEFLCNLALFAIMVNCCAAGFFPRQHGLATNEILEEQSIQKDAHLSECQSASVCNILEANIKGINVQSLCRCGGHSRCPNLWDSFDGHSLTQGSRQYKFCKHAPEVPTCTPNDVAYTSYITYSKLTEMKLSTDDTIQCKCPEANTVGRPEYDSGDLNEMIIYEEFKFPCVPIPSCRRPSDPCKSITVKHDDFQVNVNCLCPGNLSCPTVTYPAFDFFDIETAKVYQIPCQKI